nr:MAG TPA: hypothetical protein [Caudoviricetes sp.]
MTTLSAAIVDRVIFCKKIKGATQNSTFFVLLVDFVVDCLCLVIKNVEITMFILITCLRKS